MHWLASWRRLPLLLDLGSLRRMNVSLDPSLLDAIDHEARRRKMPRSAFLSSVARAEIRGKHRA